MAGLEIDLPVIVLSPGFIDLESFSGINAKTSDPTTMIEIRSNNLLFIFSII